MPALRARLAAVTLLTLAAASSAHAALINTVEMTVSDVRTGLNNGSFTSVDLVNSFLGRINTYESFYNAFVTMNPDALSQAAALDAARLANPNAVRDPLYGVPVVIKDNMDYAGLVTTAGFAGYDSRKNGIDLIPSVDSTLVTRLKAAGAIILGKTNLPDFAQDGLRSNSTAAGQTINASNITRAPGGSSGGTATAVNASFAVLGFGTETGRSIHNPSSFQGLVGVRPSQGLTPIDGIYPLNGTFRDVAGPFARTVTDAALALDVIAGYTPNDPLTRPAEVPPGGYTSKLSTTALQGSRVAYFDNQFLPLGSAANPSFRNMDAPTKTLYDAAISKISGEGATVVTSDIFAASWLNFYYSQPSAPNPGGFDQYQYLQHLGPTTPFHTIEEYKQLVLTNPSVPDSYASVSGAPSQTTSLIDPSTTTAGALWVDWQSGIRSLFEQILDDNDLDGLAFPISGMEPPPLNGNSNNDPLIQGIINILGVPGVIVPAGTYADGSPFNIIFIGRRWHEADMLGLAYDFEQATHARVAPTLVPEPVSLSVLAIGSLMLLRRRARS